MALQLAYTTEFGINLPTAYHQVVGIVYDSPNNYMQITVGIYVDVDAKNNDCPPMVLKNFTSGSFNKDAPYSAFTLIYGFLKTLPEYAGAIDV